MTQSKTATPREILEEFNQNHFKPCDCLSCRKGGRIDVALAKLDAYYEELIYQYKGGEDDGYGGKTSPITWKEAYEEQQEYESWAMKEMKKSCEKIKAHPEWKYGENAYPSPYERAIVAGCSQAVAELEEQSKKYREGLQYIVDHAWVVKATDGFTDTQKWLNEFVDKVKEALNEETTGGEGLSV